MTPTPVRAPKAWQWPCCRAGAVARALALAAGLALSAPASGRAEGPCSDAGAAVRLCFSEPTLLPPGFSLAGIAPVLDLASDRLGRFRIRLADPGAVVRIPDGDYLARLGPAGPVFPASVRVDGGGVTLRIPPGRLDLAVRDAAGGVATGPVAWQVTDARGRPVPGIPDGPGITLALAPGDYVVTGIRAGRPLPPQTVTVSPDVALALAFPVAGDVRPAPANAAGGTVPVTGTALLAIEIRDAGGAPVGGAAGVRIAAPAGTVLRPAGPSVWALPAGRYQVVPQLETRDLDGMTVDLEPGARTTVIAVLPPPVVELVPVDATAATLPEADTRFELEPLPDGRVQVLVGPRVALPLAPGGRYRVTVRQGGRSGTLTFTAPLTGMQAHGVPVR